MVQIFDGGGDQAILNSLEGFEDDWDLGYLDAKKFKITQKDLIVGLSASGNTRYVKGFFDYAKNSMHTISLLRIKQVVYVKNLVTIL
ncbi:hypothetical protein ONA24_06130 [Mycoplasmopsis cynos]|uniref:hypothetical protein n=1 Tax=Mycoplasmopsis cynos TaxID=171284 RepID=UPI0024C9A0DB|nr:hypothetical protein [Mycoplasmopsis cynos]WAM09542.1 hypothetical protein ONA24_06130 [Mycoplasmopsis cynos]